MRNLVVSLIKNKKSEQKFFASCLNNNEIFFPNTKPFFSFKNKHESIITLLGSDNILISGDFVINICKYVN